MSKSTIRAKSSVALTSPTTRVTRLGTVGGSDDDAALCESSDEQARASALIIAAAAARVQKLLCTTGLLGATGQRGTEHFHGSLPIVTRKSLAKKGENTRMIDIDRPVNFSKNVTRGPQRTRRAPAAARCAVRGGDACADIMHT